ncbi:hypothetical protein BH18ACT11_BH18ACT11_14110 [soil metagenome]
MTARGYDYDVFINCPFDPDYRSMLDALVFAVHDCGFQARCALEMDDSGRVRIENLVDLIQECRYGIHDISRTELDDANNLPRFNMPLELGLFMGATRFGSTKQKRKRTLILDREPYRYQKFISDIAGQDIKSHDDDPDLAMRQVRNWLSNSPTMAETIIPSATRIVDRYTLFREELPELCRRSHLDPETSSSTISPRASRSGSKKTTGSRSSPRRVDCSLQNRGSSTLPLSRRKDRAKSSVDCSKRVGGANSCLG